MRARFDDCKTITDQSKARQLVADGERELFNKQHYQPKKCKSRPMLLGYTETVRMFLIIIICLHWRSCEQRWRMRVRTRGFAAGLDFGLLASFGEGPVSRLFCASRATQTRVCSLVGKAVWQARSERPSPLNVVTNYKCSTINL